MWPDFLSCVQPRLLPYVQFIAEAAAASEDKSIVRHTKAEDLTRCCAAHGALVQVVSKRQHCLKQRHEVRAGLQLLARLPQRVQLLSRLHAPPFSDLLAS